MHDVDFKKAVAAAKRYSRPAEKPLSHVDKYGRGYRVRWYDYLGQRHSITGQTLKTAEAIRDKALDERKRMKAWFDTLTPVAQKRLRDTK